MASFFWSINFHHLLLITHHLSLITQFFTSIWHHHPISITQYFSHYLWAHTCQLVQLFFFFLFSVPKLTEANIKKKKKNQKLKTELVKKKKPRIEDWSSEKKKSQKVVKSCGCGSLHVCLFTKMPLSYELWKQSYENRVIVWPNNLFAVGPSMCVYLRKCHWVMSYGNWKQPFGCFPFS